jgi:hypothetical protein
MASSIFCHTFFVYSAQTLFGKLKLYIVRFQINMNGFVTSNGISSIEGEYLARRLKAAWPAPLSASGYRRRSTYLIPSLLFSLDGPIPIVQTQEAS